MSQPNDKASSNDAVNTGKDAPIPAPKQGRRPVLSERVDEILEFSDAPKKSASDEPATPSS